MSEDDALVSGWRGIYTVRYEGFNSRNIDEFKRILDALENSVKYLSVHELYNNTQAHISNPDAHQITLNANDVLNQIYDLYRDIGNTGTLDDLVSSIDKNIKVCNQDELSAGISTSKAVPATLWKPYWITHLNRLSSHMVIRETITPDNCVNMEPVFFFDADAVNQLQYSLEDIWNTEGTTIVFRCTRDTGELFHITFGDHLLSFVVSANTVEVLFDDQLLIDIDNTQLDIDTYVFAYSPVKIVLHNALHRNEIKTTDFTDNDLFGSSGGKWSLPSSPEFLVFNDYIGNSDNNLYEFIMYNFPIKQNEEVFFIN